MWEPGYSTENYHIALNTQLGGERTQLHYVQILCIGNCNSGRRSPILLPSGLLQSTLLLNEILVHQQGQQCSVRTLPAQACSTLLQHTSVYSQCILELRVNCNNLIQW